MLLEQGEKIHVVQRRSFETDLRRHFVGEVMNVTEWAVRAKGYKFVFDKGKNQYFRLPELRTRIIPLTDASMIINVLPRTAKVDKASYTLNNAARLVVTDGETFSLDINEFGFSH